MGVIAFATPKPVVPPVDPPTAPWTGGTPIEVWGGESGADIELTPLNDGNFMVMYGEGDVITPTKLKVYDPSLSQVGSIVQIMSSGSFSPTMATLNNGNVVIAYKDNDDSNIGKYGIFSPAGATVKAFASFSGVGAVTANNTQIVPMADGGFMLLYCPGNDNFQTVVYDSAGTETNRPSVVSMSIYHNAIYAKLIPAGGVLVAYLNNGDYEIGYMVLNTSGVVTHTQAYISEGYVDQDYMSCAILDDGNYFFAWYDDEDWGDAVFAIWNASNNTVITGKTPLDDGDTFGNIQVLSDGNLAIYTNGSIVSQVWIGGFYQNDGTFIQEISVGSTYSGYGGRYGKRLLTQLTGGKVVGISTGFGGNNMINVITGT